jgi:hypothetical protein
LGLVCTNEQEHIIFGFFSLAYLNIMVNTQEKYLQTHVYYVYNSYTMESAEVPNNPWIKKKIWYVCIYTHTCICIHMCIHMYMCVDTHQNILSHQEK